MRLRPAAIVASAGSLALGAGLIMPLTAGAHGVDQHGVERGVAAANNNYTVTTINGAVLRWNPCQAAVTYKVNVKKAGKGKKRKKALKEVKKAFKKTQSATGINFVYKGKTKAIPTGSSWHQRQNAGSEIVVAYVTRGGKTKSTLLGGGALGTGGLVYKTWQDGQRNQYATAGRGYVVIDAKKAKRMKKGFKSGVSRGNLLMHELAHTMGLGHVHDPTQLMHDTLTSRSPKGFASGDRAGLRAVGRPAGCVDVPSFVWNGA